MAQKNAGRNWIESLILGKNGASQHEAFDRTKDIISFGMFLKIEEVASFNTMKLFKFSAALTVL